MFFSVKNSFCFEMLTQKSTIVDAATMKNRLKKEWCVESLYVR